MGVTAEVDTNTNKVYFKGNSNQSIRVEATGDNADTVGFGGWQQGTVVTGNGNLSNTYDLVAGDISVVVNGAPAIHLIVETDAGGPGGLSASAADVLADVKGSANYNNLKALGVEAYLVGSRLAFMGTAGQTIGVTVASDASNRLGLAAPTVANNTIQTGMRTALVAGSNNDTATLAFSINGGDKILVNITSDGSAAGLKTAFDTAIANNAQLKAAGIQASANLATISSSNTSVNFRMMVEKQTGTLDLGLLGTTAPSSLATFSTTSKASMLASGGASQTGLGSNNDVYSFKGLKNVGATATQADSQVISFSANDSTGTAHSLAVTLDTTNAGDVDSAVTAINAKLQGSNDSTLKQIVAVKQTNAAGTAEGIRFISSVNNFSVLAGISRNSTTTVPLGMYDGTSGATAQGVTVQSGASGAIDISSKEGAKQAVIALGDAVKALGVSQSAVGKGQNQLSYAIGLAQAQISNFSSAQAQIRDADVAAEAANLTKAQVLQQASMAAMAQANTAPQAVLALLKG
jgi:flagellin